MRMSELSGQDVDAIQEIHDRWIREELAGNSSQVIELCTDDVKWIPPNAPPLVGKEAIAQYLKESSVELKDVHVKEVIILGSGSIAYLTSGYHSRFVDEWKHDIQDASGTHLWVLRKTGGVWKVAIVAWSLWAAS
jgi:uncharacterized protein (TIGR02246 family)